MLSIVIPSYNRPDLLRVCLSRVVQYAPPQTQVVVVDDGSPEGKARTVAESYGGVEVVGLSRRRGFCAAANAGLRAARGDIVELLNDDTEVTSGWAAAAVHAFRDASVAAVAPLVLYWPDGRRVDSAGDRYYLGGVAGKRGHGEPLGPQHEQAGPVFGASASSAFYRREALVQVGAFPESFGAYFEDVDVAFRLHRAGYRVWYEPASRVLHHVSGSYGRPGRRLVEQQSHNEEHVFWRNVPGRALLRALPAHLAVLAAKAWRRWREGVLVPFVCGRLRILTDLAALLRHRRRLRGLGPVRKMEAWQVETRFWGLAGVVFPITRAIVENLSPGNDCSAAVFRTSFRFFLIPIIGIYRN
jgi:GT2 family glycosyltransferase